MASCNNFLLLILLTATLVLVADAAQKRRTIPSEEEKADLEKQLKAINKPGIKSFKTEHGDIFDCIDIHKQPSFDHHLLKNHSVQLKPTVVPEWITGNNTSQKLGPMLEGISCPDGTVIVKRTTMQDLINEKNLKSLDFHGPRHFLTKENNTSPNRYYEATINYGSSSFSGVKGNLNLWDPQIFSDQFSSASMGIRGGPIPQLFTIFVGWMVNPTVYKNDHVHLFSYWTTHGSGAGCFDYKCPGFVQVSRKTSFGSLIKPVSIYDGPQYEIELSLYQDRVTGDWWFSYGGENVGYWSAAFFSNSGNDKGANYASWGGRAYSPVGEEPPVMGSGHWPSEGYKKAAFVNGIQIIDPNGKVFDPESETLKVSVTDSSCYRAIYVYGDEYPWKNVVYYGGPAGCKGLLSMI